MKTGKTLQQLAAEIERQHFAKRDLVASTKDIAMMADPSDIKAPIEFEVGTEVFKVNDLAHDQIGNHTGIPSKYYDKMRAQAPALLAANVNTWLHEYPTKRLVRTLDGTTRAFLSDAYRPMENYQLAEAVLPVLTDLKVEIISCEITERRLYLKVVDQSINRDIPIGARMGDGSHNIFDTCVPAMVISNSEVGSGMLSIETATWTKACTNLAVFAQDSMKKRHVGARHELVADEGIAELLSDNTRRLTDEALWSQVRDVCKGAFDEARFDARVAKLTDSTKQKIEGDPVKVVEFTSRRFGMTEDERGGVLRHLIEGGSLTRYGLFNAITRTAEDLPGYDRATEFERMGGLLIDLPASAWKKLSNAEGDPTRAELLAA